MRLSVTKTLFSYWNMLRGARATPERTEIDPTAIRSILADTFMIEIDQLRTYPMRLAGARIGALFLHDMKGLSFLDLWNEEDRETLATLFETVLDEPTPAIVGVSAAPMGRSPLELELLLLPLRHNGRTHARIMGSLSPASLPSWFGLLPVESLSLKSFRIMGREAQIWETAASCAVQMATKSAANAHFPARRSHLSVYSGGLDMQDRRSE